MKPLILLTDCQRAQLILDLHPELRENLVDFIERESGSFIEDQKTHRNNWQHKGVDFEWWLGIVKAVHDTVKRETYHLRKSAKIFAATLFNDLRALASKDYIIKFARANPHEKTFALIVGALFCVPSMYSFSFEE